MGGTHNFRKSPFLKIDCKYIGDKINGRFSPDLLHFKIISIVENKKTSVKLATARYTAKIDNNTKYKIVRKKGGRVFCGLIVEQSYSRFFLLIL